MFRILTFMGLFESYAQIQPADQSKVDHGIGNYRAERDSTSRKKQEDLEASCLKRDGYRCVLRGAYQEQYFMTQLSAHEKTRQYWEEHTVAHILPHVLGEFDEKNVEENGCNMMGFLALFGIINP
ncbi:hypothetical protein QC762_0109910 [Podospora pseudocomata]|uniref:HNH nuclease domain-containing protein n=1 Tax=Podospora pseudocomata TaxID=2093779 RepID=A0ABR0G3W8_9PEZI|nr:hypothetical protein QC762_0109910 [Podospora pseudocomata]